MIAGILIGKLCIVAAIAAVALILEIGVPILRLKLLARWLAEDEKVGKIEGDEGDEQCATRRRRRSSCPTCPRCPR